MFVSVFRWLCKIKSSFLFPNSRHHSSSRLMLIPQIKPTIHCLCIYFNMQTMPPRGLYFKTTATKTCFSPFSLRCNSEVCAHMEQLLSGPTGVYAVSDELEDS